MTVVDGAPVAPHVQAFADEINRRFGFTHILTYPGHQPDQQHALDNFGPGPNPQAKMLELAWWCTRDDVIDHFGIDYVIFNADPSTVGGEIWNREIKRAWRQMPNRGTPTQNHHDHVHVSFNPTGSATPFGGPPSPIAILEDDMFDPSTDGQRLKNVEQAVADMRPKVDAIFGAAGREEDAAVNTDYGKRLQAIEAKLDQLLAK